MSALFCTAPGFAAYALQDRVLFAAKGFFGGARSGGCLFSQNAEGTGKTGERRLFAGCGKYGRMKQTNAVWKREGIKCESGSEQAETSRGTGRYIPGRHPRRPGLCRENHGTIYVRAEIFSLSP